MTKRVFTLASLTVVCACGLVIDPDKLIEGNASSVGNPEAGPDGSIGGGTDASAADGSLVEVPECVPPLPSTTGAEGPYAVVTAAKGTPATCPPGYLPTVVAQGDAEFKSSPATCASSMGCSCGSATGTAKCGLRLRYYDDSQCAGAEADSPTPLGGIIPCSIVDNENFIELEATVSGISCAPSGSATPSAKPAPSFGTTTIVCAPDPKVETAQCKGDNIALPAAKDAEACIIVPMNASCSSRDYGSARFLSKSGAFTDDRACACECTGNATASCAGGSARTWANSFCSGASSTSVAVGACRARTSADDTVSIESLPTATASPSCAARATPTGEASATFDLKLCCLGGGDGS